jgi:hypothetical protein
MEHAITDDFIGWFLKLGAIKRDFEWLTCGLRLEKVKKNNIKYF